ncbi:hypothetical protein L2E82_15644 [Cichorium intybus]|uniref:Uncharacterized protein n=1 Tax=Cichorium intybus TaxID=13427 RepID=A0ACB9F3S7_CICIN|nr:hypothetical protein L2E82_15644 [Cichorium intybus]
MLVLLFKRKVDGCMDLEWNDKVIHIVAQNLTKWYFAKRFLHPPTVSVYDYIFLWDEDLGVKHFNPIRCTSGMFLMMTSLQIWV